MGLRESKEAMTEASKTIPVTVRPGSSFDVYSDGSGFVGTVHTGRTLLAVSYAGRLMIQAVADRRGIKPKIQPWEVRLAREVADGIRFQLSAEWHAAHDAMYQEA